MKSRKSMFILFAVLCAFSISAMGCFGTTKSQIKAKDIDVALVKYEGTEFDPFKEKPLEFEAIGVKPVDDFLMSVTKIQARFAFLKQIVTVTKDNMKKEGFDKAKAEESINCVKSLAVGVVKDVPALVNAGAQLVTKIQSIVTNPMNIPKIPTIAKSLKSSVESIVQIGKDIKQITADADDILKVVAGAAAEVAPAVPAAK